MTITMKKNSRLSKSRQFILLEMVFFLHTGIIGAVYTLYLLSLGLSLFEANAISAIFNIAAIVFEVPSGAMCDSIGKRKTSLFAGVTLFLAMLCFLSSVNILVTVMGQVFWGLSYALESGTIEAWFVNDGALKGNELDRVFAASSKIQSVIMIVGSFIGSWLADYSLKFIWLIPCISSVCFIIMVLKFVEDKKEIQPKSSILSLYKTSIKYIKIGGSLIVKNQRITYLYIFVTLMGFISSPLMIFWSVYLKQIDSGFSYMYLSVIWVFIQVSIIIGNQILEIIGKYIKRKKILMVTFLIFGLSILFMNIKNGVMVVIVLICIQEIVWTMICSIQRGLLNDYIDDQTRTTMISFSSLFNAIGKISVSVLFGFLADSFSILFAWTISGVLSLFTIWFVHIMYKKLD